MKALDKQSMLDDLRLFIESAIESEQAEPAPFKPETEMRIELVMTNIREIIDLIPANS